MRAAYVPLSLLQKQLGETGKVNTILVEGGPLPDARRSVTLQDLGITVRPLKDSLALETDTTLIPDSLATRATAAAQSLGLSTEPVLTYLANSIRDHGREIPYSVVTALGTEDGITLNQWAAHDLNAKLGDTITLDYYVWKSDGRLHTESAQFRLAQIVPSRARRRSQLCAGISGHHRIEQPARLGPALSPRPASRPPRRRSSIGSNIAPRRKPSSRWHAGSSSGARASAS